MDLLSDELGGGWCWLSVELPPTLLARSHFFVLPDTITMGVAMELPAPDGSPSDGLRDAPEKEANSVPSTDEESNEEGEHLTGFGVEVDSLPTLIVENDRKARRSIQKPPLPSKRQQIPTVPVVTPTSSKKKKKSFRFFGKKDKRKTPDLPATTPIPTMVETKTADEVVSLLESVPEDVVRGSGPIDLDQSIEVSEAKPADVVVPATVTRNNSVKPRRRSMNPFSKKRRNSQNIVVDEDQDKSVPSVVVPQTLTVPASPLAFTGSQNEAVNQAPTESITISKILRDTPQPETPSENITKSTLVTDDDDDDDSVQDAAAGIGRKWALFFHREKGEVDDDSSDDDSSQESDYPRAVPASDLDPDELAHLVNQENEDGVPQEDEPSPSAEANVPPTVETAPQDDLPTTTEESKGFYIPWNTTLPAGIISVQDETGSVEVSDVSQDSDSVADAAKDTSDTKVMEARTEKTPNGAAAASGIDQGGAIDEVSPGRHPPSTGATTKKTFVMPAELEREEPVQEFPDKYAVNVDAIDADRGDEFSVESSIDDALRIVGAVQLPPHSTLANMDASPAATEAIEVNETSSMENVCFVESALAAINCGVCVNTSGSVEVVTPEQNANKDERTHSTSEDDASSANGAKSTEEANGADVIDEETPLEMTFGGGPLPVVSPPPTSDGIIARRKAHLAALADSVTEHHQEGTISVQLSHHDASDTDSTQSSKRSFKEKLSTIVSKDMASKARSDNITDENNAKPDVADEVDDASVVEREANAFFEQLDDESIEVSVVNEDVSTLASFADSSCFPIAQKPKYIEFNESHEETLGENIETRFCGLMPESYRDVNIQKNTESRVTSAMEACEMMAVCGRGTMDTDSAFPSSRISVDGDLDTLDTLGEEDPHDPFAFLDYFDNATLDDSFWSAVDDGTLASVRSGSVRKFRQLLRENSGSSLGNSIRVSDKGTVDDDNTEFDDSIFDTVVEEKPARQKEDQQIADADSHANGPNTGPSTDSEGTKDVDPPAVETPKEHAAATDTRVKNKLDPKARDKAIDDVRKAMTTLQKYATKHGLSEPELLWKIQEEHKKRRAWSASMAEF